MLSGPAGIEIARPSPTRRNIKRGGKISDISKQSEVSQHRHQLELAATGSRIPGLRHPSSHTSVVSSCLLSPYPTSPAESLTHTLELILRTSSYSTICHRRRASGFLGLCFPPPSNILPSPRLVSLTSQVFVLLQNFPWYPSSISRGQGHRPRKTSSTWRNVVTTACRGGHIFNPHRGVSLLLVVKSRETQSLGKDKEH